MAVTLTTNVIINLRESATEGSGSGTDKFAANETTTFVDGAGALGAPNQWNDQRTNATTTESLDLSGGVTNRLGEVMAFTKIKGIYAHHKGASGTLTLGGGSTPWVGAFTGTIILRPGSKFYWDAEDATGAACAAGTADLLQVVGSASILYEIAIWGE
jgi:hypothetical protein